MEEKYFNMEISSEIHPSLGWKVNFNNVSHMYNGLQARIFSSPGCYGAAYNGIPRMVLSLRNVEY